MGDEKLDILIRTVADTSGANQTAGALGKVKEGTKGAGEEAEKQSKHIQGLHKIFHALNEVVPGLGILMQAAFTPVGAAVSMGVMVLRTFQEKMKEVNAEFKRLEEDAAKPATRRMEAWREACVSAAVSMAELKGKLAEAANGQLTVKETTDKTIEAFKAQAEAAGSLEDAMKDNDLAAAELAQAAGLTSEEEYAQAKLEIEQRYAEKKRELQEREMMTEILIKRRAVEQAEMNQKRLTDAAEAATLKHEKALEDVAALPDKQGVQKSFEETKAKVKDFEEKYSLAIPAMQKHEKTGAELPGVIPEELYDEWKKLKGEASLAKEAYDKYPKQEARAKVAEVRAGREAELADRRAVENQEFITQGGREIGEQRSRLTSRQQGNREISDMTRESLSMQQDTALMKGPTGKLVSQVALAERARARGENVTIEQQSLEKALVDLMNKIGMHGQAVLESLKVTGADVAGLTRDVERIKAQRRDTYNQ